MVASDSFAEFLRDQLAPLAEAFPSLNYEKQGQMIDLSFWRVPERLFEEPDEFIVWANAALGAARRVAAKRGPSARKKARPRSM